MKDGITLELCIENGTRIDELIARGVDRVELCDNLAVGGTTVSFGVGQNVVSRCHAAGIRVMAMVRPRGGNFVYDDNEFSAMVKDAELLLEMGADGIVFGCLTAGGYLDGDKNLRLIRLAEIPARKPDAVFHMAFDHIKAEEQINALRTLADLGITRILTHGSADQAVPIEKNYPRLREYIAAAAAVEILPGGGISFANYREICAALGVTQVHGTRLL